MKALFLVLAVAVLAGCTTSNTGYPQPSSRGGGWENFRAEGSGQPKLTIEAFDTARS